MVAYVGVHEFLVFDDADVDEAVAGAIASKYRNTGQTCVCTNRFLVQDGSYAAFSAKLVEALGALKVGDGLEAGTQQGPLIDANAVAKVEEHIADAVAKDGRVIVGGRRHALGGTFFQPTVVADATPAMAVAQEETFGPLAPVRPENAEAVEITKVRRSVREALPCHL
jgi:succinate-semialdehyde dehydrogenase/glutarate-semialdehyde dehydrogenase